MNRASIIVLLAACSSLGDVDENVCGNGVLEAGEDCDSNDERCVACGIRCTYTLDDTDDEECAGVNGASGFVCGADNFCHAGAGIFRPATELSTAVDTFRGSDINSDGYGDVIVQSSTAIRVLFGNADGHPTTSQQVLTPIARGVAYYADLDQDPAHKLDIMLPAADGIVAYTSPYDVLSPYPFPSIVSSASEGTPLYSNQILPQVIGFVGTAPGAPAGSPVAYFVRDVSDMGPMGFVASAPLCGATDQTFDPKAVAIFDVRAGYQLVATTFRQGVTLKNCVLAVERTGPTTFTVTELPVNMGAGKVPASRPVFAPIGGGACPSYVVRELPSNDVVAFAGAGTTTCNYSGAPSARVLGAQLGDPVGWAPLSPPDPGTNATVAMAMASGVYAVGAAGPLTKILYIADRPLSSIAIADVNDDGLPDIVGLAHSPQNGELVEDIDVLSRFSTGFVRYRLDTEGPVDLLTIGDYDGNTIKDVAYVQTRVVSGVQRYELVISYATGDQLLPGVSAGTYGKIISLIPAEIPDSNDPFSVVSDLVVLYQDFAQTAITILHGSPQRTMLGFFDPRVSQLPSTFRGVVAGNFNTAAGPAGLDMIAIEDGDSGIPRVWRSNGPTGGEVENQAFNTVAQLADCSRAGPATICIDGSLSVAWPMTDTTDRVIVFGNDRANNLHVVSFDPHASTVAFPSVEWPALAELPARGKVLAAQVVTIGGAPMLVVSTFNALESHLVLCAIERASGVATACYDIGERISQPGSELVCTHATTARIRPLYRFIEQPSMDRDLIAICHDKSNPDATNLISIIVENNEPVRATKLDIPVGRAREVRVGDIDGNGIDDFFTIDRENAVPTLRIYRQCTSREVKTCAQ